MGVAGRDYMRDDAGGRARWVPGRTVWILIAVNAGLWVLFTASVSWGRSAWGPALPRDGLAGLIYDHLLLHAEQVFESGKLWQLFTCFWFHDWISVWHVLMNMFFLYFFGMSAEMQLGKRGFLKLYLLGGVAAALIYTGYAYASGTFKPALGASGAVYAVMVWTACMFPRRVIYLFFVLPVQLWVLVGVILIGRELMEVAQHARDAGSAVAHLAGAAWGYCYFRFFPRYAGSSTKGAGGWLVTLRRKRAASREAHVQRAQEDVRERVDALLTKISEEGMQALTEEEKSFLQEASKRFR